MQNVGDPTPDSRFVRDGDRGHRPESRGEDSELEQDVGGCVAARPGEHRGRDGERDSRKDGKQTENERVVPLDKG